MFKGSIAFMAAAMISGSTYAASLEADYQFQNNLSSSVAGAPDLTAVGTGTVAYASETVDGQPRTVYQFNTVGGVGAGLRAQTNGVISASSYSLVFYARIDVLSTALSKLIDFKNLTTDAGLYTALTFPTFYNAVTPEDASLTAYPTSFAQLALTRSAAGTVTTYLNGTSLFDFPDTNSLAVIDDPNSANEYLHFFFDDPNSTIISSGLTIENPSGAIARLRLYDGDLSAAEVAALDTVPEPGMIALVGVAGMLLIRRRTPVIPNA